MSRRFHFLNSSKTFQHLCGFQETRREDGQNNFTWTNAQYDVQFRNGQLVCFVPNLSLLTSGVPMRIQLASLSSRKASQTFSDFIWNTKFWGITWKVFWVSQVKCKKKREISVTQGIGNPLEDPGEERGLPIWNAHYESLKFYCRNDSQYFDFLALRQIVSKTFLLDCNRSMKAREK